MAAAVALALAVAAEHAPGIITYTHVVEICKLHAEPYQQRQYQPSARGVFIYLLVGAPSSYCSGQAGTRSFPPWRLNPRCTNSSS